MEKDEGSENKLIVQNELGKTEYKFRLGLGEKPPVGESVEPLRTPSFCVPFLNLVHHKHTIHTVHKLHRDLVHTHTHTHKSYLGSCHCVDVP